MLVTIQSVLDVKDDTPLPKNAGSQSAFDRSILILTPQRALKFTAVSRERHYIWLTALSFLSHPSQGMDDLASPPPVPQQEYQRPRSQAPVIGPRRTPIRDSIRVAKAKSRPTVGVHSYSSPTGVIQDNIVRGAGMAWEDNDVESEDAAEPPQVPRVAAHIRKRSSTGSRPVPLSPFQSYLSDNMATSLSSTLQAPTSREKYDRYTPEPRFGSGPNKTQDTLIGRITESSTLVSAPVVPDNFFDQAAGTVRMEAFIGKENGYIKPRRGDNESWSYGTRQRRKKDWSYWGGSETVSSSVIGSPPVRDDDPFTAF